MKIIQIASAEEAIFGLSEDGQLYLLVSKDLGFGLTKPTWEIYCTEYGIGLTKSALDQVVEYITGYCYTSTKISEKLKERYGTGATVTKLTDNELEMVSNDRRVTLIVKAVKVLIEDEIDVKQVHGLEITTIGQHDTRTATVVNRRGCAYVRY